MDVANLVKLLTRIWVNRQAGLVFSGVWIICDQILPIGAAGYPCRTIWYNQKTNLTPSSYNYCMSHPFDAIDMFISWQDTQMGLLFKLFFTKRYIPFNIPISSIKQFVSGWSLWIFNLLGKNGNYWYAILLDIDNGPSAMTDSGNRLLYGCEGIRACRHALREQECLAVWSA